jgi:Tfp pilus assembly protein PilO
MKTSDAKRLHSLPKNLYLEYIRLFPITQIEQVKSYTTLLLTACAIIIFSVFAITPTFRTIIELRKTLADSAFADNALEVKLQALESLQTQYGQEANTSFRRVGMAIPTTPEVSLLLAKIQTLATRSQVRLIKLEALEVELTKKATLTKQPSSFVVTMSAAGNYDQTLQFIQALHHFDRIVIVESLTIDRNAPNGNPLLTTIRARAYFHPEAL